LATPKQGFTLPEVPLVVLEEVVVPVVPEDDEDDEVTDEVVDDVAAPPVVPLVEEVAIPPLVELPDELLDEVFWTTVVPLQATEAKANAPKARIMFEYPFRNRPAPRPRL
jgi:hypothetical protein